VSAAGGLDVFVACAGRRGFAGGGEGAEVLDGGNHGDAGQHLLQVVGEGGPVVRGVQQAVDVVENVVLRHFRSVGCPIVGQGLVGDVVHPRKTTIGVIAAEQIQLALGTRNERVAREELAVA
jgi:hypothetical protein